VISARKISMLAAFAAVVLSSPSALRQISDDVVKIGVLTDMNGPASTPTGQGSVTAAQMAVDDFGGKVLGKPIHGGSSAIISSADIGAGIARRWYDVEQVDLIVDVPVSAVGAGGQNIRQRKEADVHPRTRRERGFPRQYCSPYTIQWVFDTRALASAPRRKSSSAAETAVSSSPTTMRSGTLLKGMPRRDTKNGWPRCSARVRPPFATSDLSSFILQAQASKAKIIGIAAGRPNNINESRPPANSASSRAASRMAGRWRWITDIHSLGFVAQGLLRTTSFYWDHGRQDPRMSKRSVRQDDGCRPCGRPASIRR